RAWRHQGLDVREPSLKEGCDRQSVGLNVAPTLKLRDQPGAFDLGLTFRAPKAVPFAPSLPCLGITRFDDDGPMTGRAFADMALHFESSFGSVRRLSSESFFGVRRLSSESFFGSVTRLCRKRSSSSGGRSFASFSIEWSGKALNHCNAQLILSMISAC